MLRCSNYALRNIESVAGNNIITICNIKCNEYGTIVNTEVLEELFYFIIGKTSKNITSMTEVKKAFNKAYKEMQYFTNESKRS